MTQTPPRPRGEFHKRKRQKARTKHDPVMNPNPNPAILEGLSSIAFFLGKSNQTAAKWITRDGLPATKTPAGMWITHKTLVLQWMYAGHLVEIENKKQSENASHLEINAISAEPEALEALAKAMGIEKTYGAINKQRIDEELEASRLHEDED